MSQVSMWWKRLILVTGHRRSGTSWVSALLGEADGVHRIPYEPLWLTHQPESPFAKDIQEWWQRSDWYFKYDPDLERDRADAGVLRSHLEWLCDHYFHAPVDTLIIKEPHPNWLEFLIAAYRPQQAVVLRRHVLGVLNSYDEHGLYHRWDVDHEWAAFCGQVPEILPEWQPKIARAKNILEKAALLVAASERIQQRSLKTIPHLIVDYEALCLESEVQIGRLYRWLGFAWDSRVLNRLQDFIEPQANEIGLGFVDVRKRSVERAYAWRYELAPHLIRRIERFYREVDLQMAFPGNGLPALKRDEILRACRKYISRRNAYRRQFGLRALLQSA